MLKIPVPADPTWPDSEINKRWSLICWCSTKTLQVRPLDNNARWVGCPNCSIELAVRRNLSFIIDGPSILWGEIRQVHKWDGWGDWDDESIRLGQNEW